jgi:hypothetical protein
MASSGGLRSAYQDRGFLKAGEDISDLGIRAIEPGVSARREVPRVGAEVGVRAPINETVVALVRALESAFPS